MSKKEKKVEAVEVKEPVVPAAPNPKKEVDEIVDSRTILDLKRGVTIQKFYNKKGDVVRKVIV